MIIGRRGVVAGLLGGALLPGFPARSARAGTLHEVAIRNFVFDPARLSVRPGDVIRFTNHDLAPHTATADDGSWDTGALEQGESAELTVADDWAPGYFCAYHPAMTAMLVIG